MGNINRSNSPFEGEGKAWLTEEDGRELVKLLNELADQAKTGERSRVIELMLHGRIGWVVLSSGNRSIRTDDMDEEIASARQAERGSDGRSAVGTYGNLLLALHACRAARVEFFG